MAAFIFGLYINQYITPTAASVCFNGKNHAINGELT